MGSASSGCRNNGGGGHKTPNPSFTDYGNPFEGSPFGFDMSGDLQQALFGLLSSIVTQLGNLSMWVITIYVVTALSGLMLLWFYALLRYYRDATHAVVVGFSWTQPSHAGCRILLALLICLFSIVLSPVVAVLWPLWIPMLVVQVLIWAARTALAVLEWTKRLVFVVLGGTVKYAVTHRARFIPSRLLSSIGRFVPSRFSAGQQSAGGAAHNHFTQMGDTIVELHRENGKTLTTVAADNGEFVDYHADYDSDDYQTDDDNNSTGHSVVGPTEQQYT